MAHIFSCSLEQITRIVQLDPSALNLTDGFILIFYQFALMAVILSLEGLNDARDVTFYAIVIFFHATPQQPGSRQKFIRTFSSSVSIFQI
jgi:hypothetical protein